MDFGEFFQKTTDETVQELNTDPERGLSAEESQKRLEEQGLNEIPKVKQSLWKVYVAPLLNWLIVIYLISATLLVILANISQVPLSTSASQTTIVFGIVGVNCGVAVIQQIRAQKSLKALQQMAALTATIIRDGRSQEIDTRFLVVGDLASLKQGDKIPADIRIIHARNLQVNEASLTGESVPVRKDERGDPLLNADAPIQDRLNMLFLGTFVATGNALGIVVKTGGSTEIGKISQAMSELTTGDIPLRRKVNNLAKILALIVVILLSLTFMFKMMNLASEGKNLVTLAPKALAESIGTAMGVIPINIPLLTTIVLLTGVLAMAQKGVIIRDLSAVESLGRVSVVCTDKTGTLTKNQMTIQQVFCNGEEFAVTGVGYEPIGEIQECITEEREDRQYLVPSCSPMDLSEHPYLALLLKSGLLNNNSEIVKESVETTVKDAAKKAATVWKIIGAPTEGALITLFEKSGLDRDAVRAEYREIREFSFDSAVKRMSKIFEHGEETGDSELVVFTKGATEVLQNLCSTACIAGEIVPWDDIIAHYVVSKVNKWANQGYRVLSLAYRTLGQLPPEGDDARKDVESDLTYLGFVAILDPPRDGVLDAVLECERAGVMVVMITGDSPSTAHSIAQQLHISTENELVVEGRYIDMLTDEEFQRTAVFARVSPEHKQKIVERYQQRLHRIVAMTGDGVNDALALGMADAGIAMGITGTDVAKQAADMVISDDSFTSIAVGIKEGRGLFQKIRIIIYFYICANLSEGLLIFIASLLLPGDVLFLGLWGGQYIALLAHTLPPFSLVFDNMGAEVMEEKPRDSEEIFDRFVFKTLLFQSFLLGLGCGLVYYICYTQYFPVYPNNLLGFFIPNDPLYNPLYIQKARTMYITTVMIAETLMVLSIRRFNKSVFRSIPQNPYGFLYFMIGLMFFLHLSLMYWPGVAPVVYGKIGFPFNLIWLTGSDWAVCILLALPSFFGIELWKYFARKRRKFF